MTSSSSGGSRSSSAIRDWAEVHIHEIIASREHHDADL
jgi:hypothetical protein